MADERKIDRLKRLSNDQQAIRNIATSAHIHHGKCVAPDTRISLVNGRMPTAKDIHTWAEQHGKKVREDANEIVFDISGKGLNVFSLNPETGKLEQKEASHSWKLKGGTAITVTLRNGLTATTTPEHKFWVLENMEFVQKEATELKLGDRVVTARKLDVAVGDIRQLILHQLSTSPCYARINPTLNALLKKRITAHGLSRIAKQLNVQPKSFYHSTWQNKHHIKHLLLLAHLFGISDAELYKEIDSISFRKSAKSTQAVKLPQNPGTLFSLAGLMFGKGTGNKFVVRKQELSVLFFKLCKALGTAPSLKQYKDRTPYYLTHTGITFLLHTLFNYPLRKKSCTTSMPEFLTQAPKECIARFISAYFDCDGTVEQSRGTISVSSASPQMLKGLQLLLLRFGCPSNVRDNTLSISGLSARKFTEDIGFFLKEKQNKAIKLADKVQGSHVVDIIPFTTKRIKTRKVHMASITKHHYKYEHEVITPTLPTAKKIAQHFSARNIQTVLIDRLTSGDLCFVEVAKIETATEPIVYDLSVPGHRNFVAEGMIINNTALTDNLLAASGHMSEQAAGDLKAGMATWQHADEQERLMTVDAANVSMVHEYQGKEYLINLIDTPGHVDFGGNVTRAMRAIDGTIVLVCASEGIMPQTETVLRQALKERVKPVLFINKVDRLITEMQYTPEKIQQRIAKIIIQFNRLIDHYAEKEFKEAWKVNIQDGSVAFGSARENWAVSAAFMQKKNISFKDILDAYDKEKEERDKWFWDNAPLYEVLLDMVIKHLPNPVEAQKYRISKIWTGDINSELGQSLLHCDPKGKLAFVITRVLIDIKSGREISAGRLYGGTIKDGMQVYLNGLKQQQRVAQVLMYNGVKPEIVNECKAGNVLALMGITGDAGETITLEPDQPFEELKHIFEPVITKAVSPTKPQDLSKLVEVLKKVNKEDPSVQIKINEETGENLISGMGELHLEIIENRIKTEKGLEIKTSPPIVVYRETVAKESPEAEGKTPNKHNKIYVKVEPLEPEVQQLIKDGNLPTGKTKKKDMKIRDTLVDVGYSNDTALAVRDIYKGNILIDATKGIVQIGEVMELLIDGFHQVMDEGPLAREPCMGLKVIITDLKLHEDAIHRGPAQMYPAMRDGIKSAMMAATPTLFEPMQVHIIEAPKEYTGELTKLVMNKRGQVIDLQQEGNQAVVKAKLPVAEMLGWSNDLRSATEGRGTSSLSDQKFEKMPIELQQKVIQQIVQRKGLTAGQLGA